MATNQVLQDELSGLFDKLKGVMSKSPQEDKKQESGDSSAEIEDPVKHHVEEIIKKIDDNISNYPKDDEQHIKLLLMKGSILYEQAKMKLARGLTDESKELLQKSLNEIADVIRHKHMHFLYLRLVNHISYLHSRTGDLEKAKELLESVIAEDVIPDITVYNTEELFSKDGAKMDNSDDVANKLNKLMVNNMQMLAWVYGKLGFHDLHTQMQHKALQKQLDTADGDPLNWVCRCCRLATLFLTQCQWVHVRYHLAAAGVILERLEKDSKEHPDLRRTKADLARAWIHYGLHLFSVSKKIILDRIYFNEEPVSEDETPAEETPLPPEYEFTDLTLPTPDVPAVCIVTTEQARNLFLYTHSWLKQARLYYTLRDYPLHYVNAVLDLSELYRFLAFYEPDLDSQYNVQKRRADTLETLTTILREIRPSCYVSVSVELLRELTEVQIELMGINLKRLFIAEGAAETEEHIKKKIVAATDIQSKLESLGNMINTSAYDLQTVESEGQLENVTNQTVENNQELNEDDNQIEEQNENDEETSNEREEDVSEAAKEPDDCETSDVNADNETDTQ